MYQEWQQPFLWLLHRRRVTVVFCFFLFTSGSPYLCSLSPAPVIVQDNWPYVCFFIIIIYLSDVGVHITIINLKMAHICSTSIFMICMVHFVMTFMKLKIYEWTLNPRAMLKFLMYVKNFKYCQIKYSKK